MIKKLYVMGKTFLPPPDVPLLDLPCSPLWRQRILKVSYLVALVVCDAQLYQKNLIEHG